LGLELLAQAVNDAKSNAENNGITYFNFFVGKAEDTLSSVISRAVKEDILAVVDPPRAGLRKNSILLEFGKCLEVLLAVTSPTICRIFLI
jgi:tRNA/tmRNA/rRNA uracil-C5-methylase (TrmA/RlmC/RlmD family)